MHATDQSVEKKPAGSDGGGRDDDEDDEYYFVSKSFSIYEFQFPDNASLRSSCVYIRGADVLNQNMLMLMRLLNTFQVFVDMCLLCSNMDVKTMFTVSYSRYIYRRTRCMRLHNKKQHKSLKYI